MNKKKIIINYTPEIKKKKPVIDLSSLHHDNCSIIKNNLSRRFKCHCEKLYKKATRVV